MNGLILTLAILSFSGSFKPVDSFEESAKQVLISIVKSDNNLSASRAAKVLGEFGVKDAVPAIQERLNRQVGQEGWLSGYPQLVFLDALVRLDSSKTTIQAADWALRTWLTSRAIGEYNSSYDSEVMARVLKILPQEEQIERLNHILNAAEFHQVGINGVLRVLLATVDFTKGDASLKGRVRKLADSGLHHHAYINQQLSKKILKQLE